MKTSILISSYAALCLLITFAEAPRRYAENNMELISTENSISIVTTNKPIMLPCVVITLGLTTADAITYSVITAEDFSYLRFDVTGYMEADASDPIYADIFPKTTEVAFSCLKFDVIDNCTGSDLTEDEMAVNGLEYLRIEYK